MSQDRCDACGALYAMVGFVHRCIPRPKPVEAKPVAKAKPKSEPKPAKKKAAKRSKK